ncbi:uncharacterized protein GGS25DRAFT_27013 [Hypoxylon fragiforme]|uniref:uncharacterized protein n=1 Tax=Hypoxylon fragiforme TaxID=63214 RepID=UPI0020C72F79|nr:uncharacterized protein GGS25DRAFT_27013 [Hypoxylon fragiforme]KAI2613954.1 hypothetical protein GGS25DRAFT_27013 [Hypoxylon fragiforme]
MAGFHTPSSYFPMSTGSQVPSATVAPIDLASSASPFYPQEDLAPVENGDEGSASKTKSKGKGKAMEVEEPAPAPAPAAPLQAPASNDRIEWRPGMKEIKLTDDMTAEERAEAEAWNRRYAQAKGDHNRAQNRESARRSRARKTEELKDAGKKIEALEKHIIELEARNRHLSAQVAEMRQDAAASSSAVLASATLAHSQQTPSFSAPSLPGGDFQASAPMG